MDYIRSGKYQTHDLMKRIMGPNPLKLEEELLIGHKIKDGAVVCDLGSGQGLTSVFLAKEYGFKVYATDLWSDPLENARLFETMGLCEEQIVAVKADATDLPFEKDFFDIGILFPVFESTFGSGAGNFAFGSSASWRRCCVY